MSEQKIFPDVAVGSKNYISPSCHWVYVFNNYERQYLNVVFFWACLFSVVAMMWLNLVVTRTSLWQNDSYRYLTLFTVPGGLRRLFLAIASTFSILDQWSKSTCVFFAYADSFLGMLEIEGFTHACISRFVIARYAAKGWPLNRRYFEYFVYSTIAFAVFYTFIPLTGYFGPCSYDFMCTTCSYTLDMPKTSERYFIVLLFFMIYVKPFWMRYIMLGLAHCFERSECRDVCNAERKKFTSMIIEVSGSFAQCGGMLVIIKLLVIFYRLCDYDFKNIELLILCIGAWYCLHAFWPVFAVGLMVWKDEKIRDHFIQLLPGGTTIYQSKMEEKERVAAKNQLNKD